MSSSSVKRVSSSVRAVVNLAIREQGIAVNNVFSGTYIPDDEIKQKRSPVPLDVLRNIQTECQTLNDEPRWLIALISDTGMRLSEACERCVEGRVHGRRSLLIGVFNRRHKYLWTNKGSKDGLVFTLRHIRKMDALAD